ASRRCRLQNDLPEFDRASKPNALHALREAGSRYTNCSFVVGASGSQPRDGLLLIEETSLIDIWRPRVLGHLTSTSQGAHLCWSIFWYGAGLYLMYSSAGVSGSKNRTLDLGGIQW